ncbi:hypothetical protein A2U01_0062597 [Trifolium medium]|uniref:Uncharacterized protein n=1 Tax=Trifolium medium TaxID=97028 RepID=A0A392RZ54_9FABA|nr:hypothetical protein [Trifolium medium]
MRQTNCNLRQHKAPTWMAYGPPLKTEQQTKQNYVVRDNGNSSHNGGH